MSLKPECPRCASAVLEREGTWVCSMHEAIAPLWRARSLDYMSFVEHLDLAGAMPSWAPWPFPSGWSLQDFGAVQSSEGRPAAATFVTCGGLTESDGLVRLTVVTEEPGVGLGARVARVVHDDPGALTQGRPTQTKVRVGEASVPLWLLGEEEVGGVGGSGERWDTAVLVGEAHGRWLWLVTSPSSVSLGLASWGALEDLGRRGPELVELPFGDGVTDW